MAGKLIALALALGAFALGGCASTEELYAEYDELMCRVGIEPASPAGTLPAAVVEPAPESIAEPDVFMGPVVSSTREPVLLPALLPDPAPGGVMTLRERIAGSYFPWEPAVYFAFNADAPDAENDALLDGAAEVLERYVDLKVSLQGFTDRLGSDRYNAWLAARRVASVRERLVRRGVDPERIVSQPIGEGLPTFGDDDAAARAINRRVELMLLDEDGRPLHPLFDLGPLEDDGR